MPTYEFECQANDEHPLVEGYFSMSEAPREVSCAVEGCDGTAVRVIGAGAGAIFKGTGWAQDIKRENENADLTRRAKYARRLKNAGIVPQGETIKPNDVDPDCPRTRSLPPANVPLAPKGDD